MLKMFIKGWLNLCTCSIPHYIICAHIDRLYEFFCNFKTIPRVASNMPVDFSNCSEANSPFVNSPTAAWRWFACTGSSAIFFKVHTTKSVSPASHEEPHVQLALIATLGEVLSVQERKSNSLQLLGKERRGRKREVALSKAGSISWVPSLVATAEWPQILLTHGCLY